MMWVGSSQPLQDFARSWVGDTAVNGVETLEFIRQVQDFAGMSYPAKDKHKESDAWLMFSDMGGNLADFQKVNSVEVADHLNEFFEEGG
tara:strand:+ start:153 stop:419 length:267 start_codon:yes stop_codon:yes gene_type:complete